MKRHFSRIIATATTLILAVSMVIGASSTAFAASSRRYAYSVGVNHSADTDLSGDFTGNVHYAATCYGMISGVGSFYQYDPTVAYLRSETNPNGVRKLASDIVFLNGHGNYNVMAFGNSRGSGIYYGNDLNSNGYQYAGLKSIGTMNTVDFIAFVGCSTAAQSSNLASVANSKGATTSIGFTNSINSRNTYGPEWLTEFHDYFVNGYTVQQSINYATAAYPGSNLGTYIKVYGSTNNTISNGTFSRSQALDTESEAIAVPLDNLQNCTAMSIDSSNIVGLNNLLNNVQSLYDEFDPEDYKISVNMYSDDGQTGMMTLTYYVGDEIETDRAYIIPIENNVATAIIPSQSICAAENISTTNLSFGMTENDMLSKVESFEAQMATNNPMAPASIDVGNVTLQDSDELVETICRYYYDYSQGKLTYSETYIYETNDPLSVLVDTQAVWELA